MGNQSLTSQTDSNGSVLRPVLFQFLSLYLGISQVHYNRKSMGYFKMQGNAIVPGKGCCYTACLHYQFNVKFKILFFFSKITAFFAQDPCVYVASVGSKIHSLTSPYYQAVSTLVSYGTAFVHLCRVSCKIRILLVKRKYVQEFQSRVNDYNKRQRFSESPMLVQF